MKNKNSDELIITKRLRVIYEIIIIILYGSVKSLFITNFFIRYFFLKKKLLRLLIDYFNQTTIVKFI